MQRKNPSKKKDKNITQDESSKERNSVEEEDKTSTNAYNNITLNFPLFCVYSGDFTDEQAFVAIGSLPKHIDIHRRLSATVLLAYNLYMIGYSQCT
jgi:hypothetical protein